MDTRAHIAEAERYSARNYHPLPVVLTRGEGIHVWDVDGNRYVDMLSAYSALNQGHAHPRIVKALVEQAGRLSLTSRAFHNDRMGGFLKRLCELTGYEKALPMNSGAEAVETALKAARKWGADVKGVPEGEGEIVVFEDNFHGRTTTIISFSTEPLYRDGFGPFTPGFRVVPYGDLEALREVVTDRTIAVLVEPIQGEAGVVVPPEGFLKGAAALCRERNALLIAAPLLAFADEMVTSFELDNGMQVVVVEDHRSGAVDVGHTEIVCELVDEVRGRGKVVEGAYGPDAEVVDGLCGIDHDQLELSLSEQHGGVLGDARRRDDRRREPKPVEPSSRQEPLLAGKEPTDIAPAAAAAGVGGEDWPPAPH